MKSLEYAIALPLAQWDVKSFFQNVKKFAEEAGGYFLMALGTVAVIYGAYLLFKKLMAGQQNQDSWIKITLLILIGGAVAVGGWNLLATVSSGGQQTILDLGGGFITSPFGVFDIGIGK